MEKILNSTQSFIKHPLFNGTAVMILGSNFANFISYLYHLIFGRLLGPERYSELAAIISVIGFIAIAYGFIGTVIMKFASSGTDKEVKSFFIFIRKKISKISLTLVIFILVASPLISGFLKVELFSVIWVGPVIFFSMLSFVNRSFMQGVLRFLHSSLSASVEMISRLLFGLLFYFIFKNVFGVVIGIFVSVVFTWVYSEFLLRDYRVSKLTKIKKPKNVMKYAAPVFIQSVAMSSMFTTDVLLVKHFFQPFDAGGYAAISNLGKIILFGTSPISVVMFPLVSKRASKGESYKKILYLSFLLTLLLASFISLVYFIFPVASIEILYGSKYTAVSPLLSRVGVFMSLFVLSLLIINFDLSLGKTKTVWFLLCAAVFQAIGITLFHATLFEVLNVSIAVVSVLLLSLVIYFYTKNGKK